MDLSFGNKQRDVFVPADMILWGSCMRQPGQTWWRRLPVSLRETTFTASMTRLLHISTTAVIKPGPRCDSSCWTCSRGASSLTLVGVTSSSNVILAMTLDHYYSVCALCCWFNLAAQWVFLNLASHKEREGVFLISSHHKSSPISPLLKLTVLTLTGCGNGKYLHINKEVFKLGCDVCRPLVDFAWSQGHEVQMCNGLHLPYRDSCFDAVLSIAGNGEAGRDTGTVGCCLFLPLSNKSLS